MKTAILQVADTGPLESLVVMLQSAGYTCVLPNHELQSKLKQLGCDTVLNFRDLVEGMGYERPMELEEVGPKAMDSADLYVDVKAHRNGPRVWERWPRLWKRTLWYRINGCAPEITKHGDEVNLICPILTPNQWYTNHGPWSGQAYVCWPPFYRWDTYGPRASIEGDPICLIHNLQGWGYSALIPTMEELGVKCYGRGSPHGLIPHGEVREKLKTAKCVVHLKSSDSPGYALYEALASACPVVVTRRLIWRSRMESLFPTPGRECFVFDRETHDSLSPKDVAECREEIEHALHQLSSPVVNEIVGEAGRDRLREIMWNEERDGESLRRFMTTHFG